MKLPMQLLRSKHAEAIQRPTRYDGKLLQTGLQGDPWRVAVASMLLKQTTRKQAEIGLRRLLHNWKTPAQLAEAELEDVINAVRPCGFQQRRAVQLIEFSRCFLHEDHDLMDVKGVGPYVRDAVALFCFDCTSITCDDHALHLYAESLA